MARHERTLDKRRRTRIAEAGLVVAGVSVAAFLLSRILGRYRLHEIVSSVSAVRPASVLAAGGWAAASYFCLTWVDWLAVRYAGRPLPYPYVALASFTSLSIGHNVGLADLSSSAIRYRFYSRWGLAVADVAKVLAFCGITVALGIALLAGGSFLLRPAWASAMTGLSRGGILVLGALGVALSLTYLALAAFWRRPIRIRRLALELPPFPLAVCQAVLGPTNLALVAACLHQMIAAVHDVSYASVAGVYAIAQGAAVVSHVPGGLGVIESVTMLLLPHERLVGALIAFRFVYFLVPLCVGIPSFAISSLLFWRNARPKPA